ncbi:hypothetical protein PM082_017326 [Marasmius tenuissimus]|nr:hypothetical protein PM082_017326 [Marasmius tenuissimus]
MLSSGPSCRILTVASTLERAVDLVEQIQALSPSKPSNTDPPVEGKDSENGDGKSIPWTISNKYYSADVHFWARPIKGLAPYHLQEVPAVIFAWSKGNAYKHHVVRFAQDLKGYDPEVSLAVRLPPSESSDQSKGEEEDDEEKSEDETDTDEFLSEHGFEFIDVPSAADQPEDAMRDGIPSLPRVLDALSTIMWPSMQASGKSTTRSKANLRTAALLDWAQSSADDASFEFPSDDDLVVSRNSGEAERVATRQQKEIAELARWLEEDADSKNDPWKLSSDLVHSPTVDDDELGAKSATESMHTFDRFDDDFTAFVSAPHVESEGLGNTSTSEASPDEDGSRLSPSFTGSSFNTEKLAPSYSGIMYHSLGSHPDLNDVGRVEDAGHSSEGSDDGLPTEEEIEKSAQKIFGPSFTAATSSRHRESGDDGGDDYEMTPFDLSHVMGALQGMKAEIAGMEDEQERRKAAARVALGLVYGLEAQKDGENEG